MIGEIRYVELGDVCDFLSGFPFKSSDFSSNPNDLFLVKGSNTGHQSIDFHAGPWWEADDLQSYLKYELQEGDVIIAMDRPIVGDQLKYCWIKKNDPKSLLVQRMARLRGSQELDIKYLRYIIGGSEFKGYIDSITTGANVPHISGPDIKKFSFPLPSLQTQKKIAAILSAYDDLIENNLKRIKLLEEMAQITYEEWFVRLRFPGYESTLSNSATGLPEGWVKIPLNTLSDFIFGYPFKAKHFNNEGKGTPIVRIRNIPDSFTTDFTTETVDQKYLIQRGDLLIGMDGDFYINNWMSEPAYLVQRVCNIKPKDKNNLGYITEAVREPIKFFESTLCGATVAHLGKKHLDEIMLVVPDERILKLAHCFNDFLNQKLLLARQVHLLREARDILLPRLMTGKIDVESYNPADLLKEVA